jgi:hypothetical protein
MTRWYIDWPAAVGVFVLLGATAYHFSRRTYRLVALATLVVIILLLTWSGLTMPGHRDFPNAFLRGSRSLAVEMLSPLTPDGAKHLVNSSPAGWVALAVILAAILVWFDTWCARREAPRVRVTEAPAAESGNPALDLRREITEKLKFRLAAADVHKPAAIPGGSTLDNLATVVSSSDIQGSKTTAMLIRAVNALAAKPSTYDARLYAEGAPGRRSAGSGSDLRITVDVEDARTGAIIATHTLGPCSKEDAADKAAGFTARQVLRRDPSTPAWALGSLDGEDLSAYLLSQEMSPKNLRPDGLRAYRTDQRDTLARTDSGNADAVLARYELACLHELLEDPVSALRLHLRNRVYHPLFLRGRYRLAMTLNMLASCRDRHDRRYLAKSRDGIITELDWVGMMLRKPELQLKTRSSDEQIERVISDEEVEQVILKFVKDELQAYRNRMRVSFLLLRAFWVRRARRALLDQLSTKPCWWLHPRRRLSAPWVALTIAEQDHRALLPGATRKPGVARRLIDRARRKLRPMAACYPATGELADARKDVLRKLGLKRLDDRTDRNRMRGTRGRGWPYWRKAPWQAIYNAACLYALPEEPDTGMAVILLRLAVEHPGCELDYPDEWIRADPRLRQLRREGPFRKLLNELEARRPDPQAAHPPTHRQLIKAARSAAARAPGKVR